MTIGSILLSIALLVVVGLFLARPFLRFPESLTVSLTLRQQIVRQKAVLINQIQDLAFDHDTGKIPTDVYEAERQRLIREAAVLSQQLDTLGTANDIEAQIETAVQQLRGNVAVSSSVESSTGSFCPQCGYGVDTHDNFCTHCGHALNTTMITPA